MFECLELAEDKYNIAGHRVFLAGHMAGGTMAFRIGLQSPHRFAGVLSLGGPFPSGNSPSPISTEPGNCRCLLRRAVHSEQYPVERTCDELRLFHAAGMHVTLRQYPWGDELNPQMLHDMNAWIMEQVTGEKSEPETSEAAVRRRILSSVFSSDDATKLRIIPEPSSLLLALSGIGLAGARVCRAPLCSSYTLRVLIAGARSVLAPERGQQFSSRDSRHRYSLSRDAWICFVSR